MALATFKLIATVWPFFKEWAFGGKTVSDSFKHNKPYTVFAISWFVLVALVIFLSHRLYNLGHEIVKNKTEPVYVSECNDIEKLPPKRRNYGVNDKDTVDEIKKLIITIECLEEGKNCKNEK